MNKEILRLAIPNILSNISIPLLSTVDTALMGRLSELHLGAVGIGAMIFNFIYWNFGFLRMGTTGITAQAFGRKDDGAIILTLGQALVVVLVLALLLLILQFPIGYLSFQLMQVGNEIYSLVAEYFFIRIWAAPATLALFAFMGWFFGLQNAVYPLILTVVVTITNIVFNYIFVFIYNMGVDGVAWGTVVAQYTGLLVALLLFYGKYRSFIPYLKKGMLLQWSALKKFLTINRDIFIRTVCLTLAFGFFYSRSSASGATILAVNVILLQFLNWMSYGVDGFAFASEALVGKYTGAKKQERLDKSIRLSFIWGMALAALFALIYGLGGKLLIGVFTSEVDLVEATMPFLIWMIVFPLLSTPCYIWDGVFIGLTASKAMRDSMLISFGVFIAVYYFLTPLWGNHGLWLALLLFMVARGMIQAWMFKRRGLGVIKEMK